MCDFRPHFRPVFIKLVCDEIHFRQCLPPFPPSLSLSSCLPTAPPRRERRALVLATGLCRPDAQRGASAILTPAHITRAPKGCANTSGKHFRSPPSHSVSVASSLAVSSAGRESLARSVFEEGKALAARVVCTLQSKNLATKFVFFIFFFLEIRLVYFWGGGFGLHFKTRKTY